MITAHIPAGYVTGRYMSARPPIVLAAVAGAVFPDTDLLRAWFIDRGRVHHHLYWTHIPLVWAAIGLVALPLMRWLAPGALPLGLAFLAGVLGHLVLDTIAGDIMWLWPWSDRFVSLIEVPHRWGHWFFNFTLHPVFLGEIAIWIWALMLWRRRPA